MPNGYNGKILHVDLTTGSLTVEEPKEAFYRKYLGGSAMGMHYILRDMPKGADPVGPENVLTLMTGVTTGAAISGQSRINANENLAKLAKELYRRKYWAPIRGDELTDQHLANKEAVSKSPTRGIRFNKFVPPGAS